MADESTELIPLEPDHSPEPALPSAKEPAEISIGRKHKHHAKTGDDPLDRFIARRRAQSILALKLEGRKPREIAAELNIPVKSVYWALYQLRRGGHLEAKREVIEAMTMRIKPLVVERLEERLEDPNVSEDLLIETAKGTGLFISHQKVKNDGATVQQALIVRFETVAGAPVAIGEVHAGAIDAEVVE